mgnify:CR=1 FL=1
MLDTLSPATGLVPLANPVTPTGRRTTSSPWGLTLARPAGTTPTLDLTGLTLNPVTQLVECGPESPQARRTTQTMTTVTRTTYDHKSWTDEKTDTYPD